MIPPSLDASRPALLLTGATGLIGSSWLPLLRRRYPHHQLVVLLRKPADLARFSTARIVALTGDLTQRRIGLEPAVYRQLTHFLQQIVHCAADIRFSASLDESRSTNLEGTRRLLELASQSRSFQKFAHLSTVYVIGDRPGELPEGPASPGRFLSPYQQSKFEAEQLILAASQVPSAIYRLSTVIGDSHTGRVRQFNYFHQLLRLALTNHLPVIPAHENAPIDLVTSDWAVSALDYLLAHHFTPGQILHICAGPEQSLTAHQLIDFTFDFFDQHPAAQSTRSRRRPRPVPLSEFSRYAERFLATGADARLWRALSRFLPLLGIPQLFSNGAALALLADATPALPPIRQTLPKVMSCCLETNWGRSYCNQARSDCSFPHSPLPLLPQALP